MREKRGDKKERRDDSEERKRDNRVEEGGREDLTIAPVSTRPIAVHSTVYFQSYSQ